jgi:hypothetical protein
LKRAIERHVVYPMANLLATDQVHSGDLICIDWDRPEDKLSFTREGENLAMPVRRPDPVIVAPRAAQAKGGRPVEAPGVPATPEPSPRFAR